ncbi:S-layer homology domain-containing protein [Bacillus mesophilum]|uniref:S-layer protein n=1 Tax=Bacillus mesophilum TaxID=1071718 RepID=A0A7V7RLB7_9BACI|nr:S-layer homology domain-containing protein [Bacillus mesophilum]KAB2332562.1 S-layer protein [Bacillus mesophilum]
MKKAKILLLAVALILSLLPAGIGQAATDDITGIKLEAELREAIQKGILTGYSEGVYKPDNKVTRGEFATFLARALKLPEAPHKFSDVAVTSKLAPGINAAADAGIIAGGTDGNFKPDNQITREQMVIMIKNALDYKNIDVPFEKPTILTDFDTVTASASRLAIAASVKLNITIGFPNSDGKTYRFEPARQASRAEAAAFIIRMIHAIEDFENQLPGEPGQPIEEKPYVISTIDQNGELVESAKKYKTFAEAEASWNSSSEVITFNGKVMKMASGLAYASPSIGKATTSLYSGANFRTVDAAVPAQEELRYIESTEEAVKVYIGGRTAYVKHSDIHLVPAKMIKNQNYYTVNARAELVHSIYNPGTKQYGSYEIGKAPSTLKQGVRYYSWDGTKFYTNNLGTSTSYVGKELYPYYQYLSARTKTPYTAAELDRFIDNKLAELEATGLSVYKDATVKSKVKGLGSYLKKVEAESNINALLVLGWAMHESQYGMSPNALRLNNLFGIEAYDSNPEGAVSYPKATDSVDALVSKYLNKAYAVQGDWRSNGAAPGNKGMGFNVRYATDAYWGSKLAGHMYRIDKALGFKDYNKKQVVALTNTPGTNIRSTPSSAAGTTNLVFTYKAAKMPIVIVGEEKAADGYVWYKILSDADTTGKNPYAYIRSDLADKIETN